MKHACLAYEEWLHTCFGQIFSPLSSENRELRNAFLARQILPEPLHQRANARVYGTDSLLPIETLKDEGSYWCQFVREKSESNLKAFRSSGTTSSERSISPFSDVGLALYQKASVQAFWAVLQYFFPDPQATPGISLIPPPDVWPESSLAQMVAWIGEEGELCYHNPDEDLPSPPGPVWLFATAFHLVQFADSGRRCPLPEGSVLIETGGTKGRSRSLSREELFELIETTFTVKPNRIISEYGMCELSSQAYDFIDLPDKETVPLAKRSYRFPSWVDIKIADGLGRISSSGFGTLIVDDPLRCDLPWPLRTEDMVTLLGKGRFQLHGRVPSASLKGCSLLAEEWKGAPHRKPENAQPLVLRRPPEPTELRDRSRLVSECVRQILNSDAHDKLLCEFTRSARLGFSLRDDLKRSAPRTPEDWLNAALAAVDKTTPDRWFIIPPSTHPIAALAPLALASILDLKLTIRCSSGTRVLEFWKKQFESFSQIELWPGTYRLGDSPAPNVDALLVFGSDETIAEMKEISPWPVKGFGNHVTASVVAFQEFGSSEIQNLICKDAFSLNQQGCMSSRLLILWDTPTGQYERLIPSDFSEVARSWIAPLPRADSLALVHGFYRLVKDGCTVMDRRHPDEPLVPLYRWKEGLELGSLLASRPWTLPIVLVSHDLKESFLTWLNSQEIFQKLSVCEKSAKLVASPKAEICELGVANAPSWDGRHHRRALFGGI